MSLTVPGCFTPSELKLLIQAYEQVRQQTDLPVDTLADAIVIAALQGPLTLDALVAAGLALTPNVQSLKVARMKRAGASYSSGDDNDQNQSA